MKETNQKVLEALKDDFAKVSDCIKKASIIISNLENYEYPIVVVTRNAQIDIGSLFIEKDRLGNEWNYYFSHLDILLSNNVIQGDMVQKFKTAYKDPMEYCCLMSLDYDLTGFIYIPYEK